MNARRKKRYDFAINISPLGISINADFKGIQDKNTAVPKDFSDIFYRWKDGL